MDKLPVAIDFGPARKIKRQYGNKLDLFIISALRSMFVGPFSAKTSLIVGQTISEIVVEITLTLVSRYMRRHMMMRRLR